MSNSPNILEYYSVAGYSTWAYNSSIKSLFDCGEGCALYLKNSVFSVENIFFSHHHMDHMAGLASFIAARSSARGPNEKALNIYYRNNPMTTAMFSFLKLRFSHLPFKISLIPCLPNDEFEVGKNKFVKVIDLSHGMAPCNGYVIKEKRTRLREEYKDKLSEIPSLIKNGVKVNESYIANLFAYTLDSSRFDIREIQNTEIWMADSTFLNPSDKDENTHMDINDVVDYATKANVKKVLCAHISARYFNPDFPNLVRSLGLNSKYVLAIPSTIKPVVY